jgi:hypothetical protein
MAINALDPDMRMALRALVEGEATYLQAVVATGSTFTDEERSGLMTGLQTATVEPPAEVPDYSLDHFAFAYTAGLNFVQTLVEQGGFAALDAAWTNLPRSTEQILHPDRYDTYELPLQVTMEPFEDVLGEGWQPVENKILGEWQLSRHLMSQLSFEESARAASGWGGGHYTVYWLQEEDALVLAFQLAWDTLEDAMDFAQVYATYLNNRFEDQGTPQDDGALCWLGDVAICLYDFDGDSFVVRAPDLDMALAIAASQTG